MTPKEQIDLIASVMGWEWKPFAFWKAWRDGDTRMAEWDALAPAGAEAARSKLVEQGYDCDLSVTAGVAELSVHGDVSGEYSLIAERTGPNERTATREAAAQVWGKAE